MTAPQPSGLTEEWLERMREDVRAEMPFSYGEAALLLAEVTALRSENALLREDKVRLDWLQSNGVQVFVERDSWIPDPESEETPLRDWLDASRSALAPTGGKEG